MRRLILGMSRIGSRPGRLWCEGWGASYCGERGRILRMILDCHVHVSAMTLPRGKMSGKLSHSLPFEFMRWRFGIAAGDQPDLVERKIANTLKTTIRKTPELDAVVVLAFDAVYRRDGELDWQNTHLFVSNDYVMELAKGDPRILFACSVHPYRKDAVAELERCVAAGAVMVKWLPITQNFDPSDARCFPLYEAMAHHGIVLLSHTGTENTLPKLRPETADPLLLIEALKRGVRVIGAHCGSRLMPWETDYLPNWAMMARAYEHFYGDTAALNLPGRWYAYETILGFKELRAKLVHGSDWPIISLPLLKQFGWEKSRELMREKNWLRRDVLIKRQLDFDDGYWTRAATVLKISTATRA